MTPKQMTAANRMLMKLKKIEAELVSQDCLRCAMLEDVTASALESNRQCQRTIEQWLNLQKQWVGCR